MTDCSCRFFIAVLLVVVGMGCGATRRVELVLSRLASGEAAAVSYRLTIAFERSRDETRAVACAELMAQGAANPDVVLAYQGITIDSKAPFELSSVPTGRLLLLLEGFAESEGQGALVESGCTEGVSLQRHERIELFVTRATR